MRILEIVLIVIVVVAIALRFLFVPGADEILMISLTLLGSLYFPGGALILNHVGLRAMFKGALSNVPPVRLIIGAAAGLGLSMLCVGILFKMLELIGADDMLMMGCMLTAVMTLAGVILYSKYKDAVAKYFLVRTAVATAIGVFFFLTSTMTWVRWRFHNYPAYIQASEEYYNNPGVDSLMEKRELEYYRARMPEDVFKKYEEAYNAKKK